MICIDLLYCLKFKQKFKSLFIGTIPLTGEKNWDNFLFDTRKKLKIYDFVCASFYRNIFLEMLEATQTNWIHLNEEFVFKLWIFIEILNFKFSFEMPNIKTILLNSITAQNIYYECPFDLIRKWFEPFSEHIFKKQIDNIFKSTWGEVILR